MAVPMKEEGKSVIIISPPFSTPRVTSVSYRSINCVHARGISLTDVYSGCGL